MTLAEGDKSTPVEEFEVVSQEQKLKRTIIRAVSKNGKLPEGAVPVDNPTLEEAYLAFMSTRGRKTEYPEKEVQK